MLLSFFNILIDSALTFYWSQFIMLFSTELFVTSSSLKTKSFTRIKETWLMADENTSFIHICLQNQSAYEFTSEDTYFWKKVRLSFAKKTKWDYIKSKWHVSDLIQKRKIHLRMLKTGDKDQKTTYIKTIDDWIKVINTHTDKKSRKKQTVKEEVRKIQTAEKTQDNLMQCMSNKCWYTFFFFFFFFFMFSEESEEIWIDSSSLNSSSIFSHSVSITSAPFTVFNLNWCCSKQTQWIQKLKTTADNNFTDVVSLKITLMKFVKVLTAWSQQQSRLKQMRKTESTERVKRTEKAREKDSEVLSWLNRLEKKMSAILQTLKRREKKRK